MADKMENLENELTDVKIRLRRIEEFLLSFPDASNFFHDDSGMDILYEKAENIARSHNEISASFLQRKLNIGYARASRILDALEENGIVDSALGARPRKVLKKIA